MLVRDAGESWQLVMQPDHADLAGQLLDAWGGPGFARPEPHASVVRAGRRHDDGWATWERAPRLDPERGGPQTFTRVPPSVHLAFYRAAVAVVVDEDPYAGLLVSMHMSGLYRARYGVVPARAPRLPPDEQALVDAFCDEEERRQGELVASLQVDDARRWANYALLQVADLVSLVCGLTDLEAPAGGATATAHDVPAADGSRVRVELEAVAPWRVRFAPYPFATEPLELTLVRRLVPKRDWPDDDAFRADVAAAAPETVRIVAVA